LGLAPATPLVGTVARLVAQKAPMRFVATCAAVAHRRPDAHFLLIGSGPLQRDVDRVVHACGLADRFHQLPSLPVAAGVLDQIQVVVLLSRFEGGPYLPLEAMRAGTPVVVSDVVGNRDTVEDGVSGFLVAPEDTAEAADRVVHLLDDDDARRRMGRAGRRRVAEHFDVEEMGRRTQALYDEVLRRRRPPGGAERR
jgi:glycosyltransferase involved in cell wall biosynthesis